MNETKPCEKCGTANYAVSHVDLDPTKSRAFCDIPANILEAAKTLYEYFEMRGDPEWELSGVASRKLVAALRHELDRVIHQRDDARESYINLEFRLQQEKNMNADHERDYLLVWKMMKKPNESVLDAVKRHQKMHDEVCKERDALQQQKLQDAEQVRQLELELSSALQECRRQKEKSMDIRILFLELIKASRELLAAIKFEGPYRQEVYLRMNALYKAVYDSLGALKSKFLEDDAQTETARPAEKKDTDMTPQAEITANKELRVRIDTDTQTLKNLPKSRERSLAITKLQEAVMWLGMDLKRLGTPNPYPNSKDPSNTIVDATADGLSF